MTDREGGLREIPQEDWFSGKPRSGIPCPRCGGTLVYGSVRCPDGKPGCLVLHQGQTCQSCLRQFA